EGDVLEHRLLEHRRHRDVMAVAPGRDELCRLGVKGLRGAVLPRRGDGARDRVRPPELDVASMREAEGARVPIESDDLGDAPHVGLVESASPVDGPCEREVRTPNQGVGDTPGAAGRAVTGSGYQRFGNLRTMLGPDRDDAPPSMADAVHPPP